MANEEHLTILKTGVEKWNQWRLENEIAAPDLSEADLKHANLDGAILFQANLFQAKMNSSSLRNADLERANLFRADLSDADLSNADLTKAILLQSTLERTIFCEACMVEADLREAYLVGAKLCKANLSQAKLHRAKLHKAILEDALLSGADLSSVNLYEAVLIKANLLNADLSQSDLTLANFSHADLQHACLVGADLFSTVLHGADLSYSDLTCANLTETDLSDASIQNAYIYGISVWNIKKTGLKQNNLVITNNDEPEISVDNMEVAQFIYLIKNNETIRDVIGTIAKKGVLILGRFTPERKKILDTMREKLRENNFIPIIFDFERAVERDVTETIKVLAGLSRFVIADITNPKSAPLELQALVPDYKIPFVTIIQKGEKPFSMFRDLEMYPWVSPPLYYGSEAGLLNGFRKGVIELALTIEQGMLEKKNAPHIRIRDIEEFAD